MDQTRVGIVGVGKLGECLSLGILSSGGLQVFACEQDPNRRQDLQKTKIHFVETKKELTESCQTILLSVKPHQAKQALNELEEFLTSEHLLISVCAALLIEQLREWGGRKCKIIRAMPNISCLVQKGVTSLATPELSENDRQTAVQIFKQVGAVHFVEEKYFDIVTALCGSGPAFVFSFLSALAKGAASLGLPQETATQLATEMLEGAAQIVLQQKENPDILMKRVMTPGGCTEVGIKALQEYGFDQKLMDVIQKTTEKSHSLSLS